MKTMPKELEAAILETKEVLREQFTGHPDQVLLRIRVLGRLLKLLEDYDAES